MEAQWSDSLQLGDLNIKNRVIMAALTRERCDPDLCVPTPLLQEYYSSSCKRRKDLSSDLPLRKGLHSRVDLRLVALGSLSNQSTRTDQRISWS